MGIYVVDNLVVSRKASAGASSEILLRSGHRPSSWKGKKARTNADGRGRDGSRHRDGVTPSIAKVAELGLDARVKAFEILDEDPLATAMAQPQAGPRAARRGRGTTRHRMDEQLLFPGRGGSSSRPYEDSRPVIDRSSPRGKLTEISAMGLPTAVEVSLPIRVRGHRGSGMVPAASPYWSIGAVAAGGGYYAGATSCGESWHASEYQRMMERERLRIAQDIHDDLGARVTQISLFSAMAQGNPALPEKARWDFERISRMSRELVSSLYETVLGGQPG